LSNLVQHSLSLPMSSMTRTRMPRFTLLQVFFPHLLILSRVTYQSPWIFNHPSTHSPIVFSPPLLSISHSLVLKAPPPPSYSTYKNGKMAESNSFFSPHLCALVSLTPPPPPPPFPWSLILPTTFPPPPYFYLAVGEEEPMFDFQRISSPNTVFLPPFLQFGHQPLSPHSPCI